MVRASLALWVLVAFFTAQVAAAELPSTIDDLNALTESYDGGFASVLARMAAISRKNGTPLQDDDPSQMAVLLCTFPSGLRYYTAIYFQTYEARKVWIAMFRNDGVMTQAMFNEYFDILYHSDAEIQEFHRITRALFFRDCLHGVDGA